MGGCDGHPPGLPRGLEARGARPGRRRRVTFHAWAEIFGDPVAVAVLVDHLVHHAEVLMLRGDSYRLNGTGKEVPQGDAGD